MGELRRDPAWQWGRTVLAEFLRDLEPGEVVFELSIGTINHDGQVTIYSNRRDQGNHVFKHVVTDMNTLRRAVAESTVDITVDNDVA